MAVEQSDFAAKEVLTWLKSPKSLEKLLPSTIGDVKTCRDAIVWLEIYRRWIHRMQKFSSTSYFFWSLSCSIIATSLFDLSGIEIRKRISMWSCGRATSVRAVYRVQNPSSNVACLSDTFLEPQAIHPIILSLPFNLSATILLLH